MKKSYKLEPPDGGYGYMVLAAATVIFTAVGMFYVCFTLIFNDVFITLGMGSTDIGLVMGLYSIGLAVSGYVAGPLLKIMTRRYLAFAGAVFLNAGYYGTMFVKTKAEFMVCQGVLKSIGSGFLYNVACSALNDYFLKKRLFSMSFAMSVAAVGTMLAPMLVTYCNKHYGMQGTLNVITAICMQTFVAAALLQPVAWHMKKVEFTDDASDKKLLLQDTPSEEPKTNVQGPVLNHTDTENTNNLSHENIIDGKPSEGKDVTSKIKSCLNWPLFKRFGLTCGCLGAPISIFADYTFINFLAPALYAYQWNNDQVQWAYSMLGFGDLAARILITLASLWLKNISSHLIYIVGLLIAIATKVAMLWVRGYMSTLAIMAVMGVSRCTIMMLFPVVVSDSVDSEEYPSALGICILIFGLLCIGLGPIIGAIRDATGNYMLVFLIVIGVMVAITCGWTIEFLWNWSRKTLSEPRPSRNRALST